jgi:signal transduction histidine kinase
MFSLTAIQIIPLISMFFLLSLGIIVLQSKNDLIGRVFFLISIGFSGWTFGTFMMYLSTSDSQIIFWDRFVYLSVILVFPLQYHFALLVTKYNKAKHIALVVDYIIGFLFLPLACTKYFVDGVFRYQWGVHSTAQIGHHFFAAYFLINVALLLNSLLIQRRDSRIKIEKLKLQWIIIAFIVLNFVGGISILPSYKIPIYSPIPMIAPILFSFVVGFVVYRYRFMDIRIAVKKFFIYLALSLYSFIFLFFFGWLFIHVFFRASVNGLLGIALIFCNIFTIGFYLLQSFLVKLSNKYFFLKLFNYQEVVRDLSKKITNYNNLSEIIELIVSTAKEVIGIDHAGVLLLDKTGDNIHFELAKSSGFNTKKSLESVFDVSLIYYLEKNQSILVADELALLARDLKNEDEQKGLLRLSKNMQDIKAEVCLPLINENKLIGIVILGAKLSGVYTTEDLESLSILASQAGIAIYNAQLFKQINDFNDLLKQKVYEQTKQLKEEAAQLMEKNENLNKLLSVKNNFLEEVNQQVNTPILNIENAIGKVKSGAFTGENGLVLIDSNIRKIKSIFNNFSSTFSVEDGEFKLELKKVDIREILAKSTDEIRNLPAVQRKGLLVMIDNEMSSPFVKTDPQQITRVVDNILQNAVTYTKKGSVAISCDQISSDFIKVYIADTGIGIGEADRASIFKKFGRVQQAVIENPLGAGLGLYVAKKIVEANGGELKLETSEVGKGSTFSFTLPIWK